MNICHNPSKLVTLMVSTATWQGFWNPVNIFDNKRPFFVTFCNYKKLVNHKLGRPKEQKIKDGYLQSVFEKLQLPTSLYICKNLSTLTSLKKKTVQCTICWIGNARKCRVCFKSRVNLNNVNSCHATFKFLISIQLYIVQTFLDLFSATHLKFHFV